MAWPPMEVRCTCGATTVIRWSDTAGDDGKGAYVPADGTWTYGEEALWHCADPSHRQAMSRLELGHLLGLLAEEIHLDCVPFLGPEHWVDRFGDGYAWSLAGEWTIGTDGHAMSELRADCDGFPGPVKDPWTAANEALNVVRARLSAREPVW